MLFYTPEDVGYSVGFAMAMSYQLLNPTATKEEAVTFAQTYGVGVISLLLQDEDMPSRTGKDGIEQSRGS